MMQIIFDYCLLRDAPVSQGKGKEYERVLKMHERVWDGKVQLGTNGLELYQWIWQCNACRQRERQRLREYTEKQRESGYSRGSGPGSVSSLVGRPTPPLADKALSLITSLWDRPTLAAPAVNQCWNVGLCVWVEWDCKRGSAFLMGMCHLRLQHKESI